MLLVCFAALATGPVGAPSPVTDRTVVVEPLHAFGDSVIWFEDEGRPVRAAVAAFLTTQGWDPVPVTELDAVIDRMEAGTLPDREGSCSPMLPSSRYLTQRYPGAATASVQLRCAAHADPFEDALFTPGCTVQVIEAAGRLPTQDWLFSIDIGPDGRATRASVDLPLDGADEAPPSGNSRPWG